MILLRHILRRASRSLRENAALNAAAAGVIAVAVLLLGVTLTVRHNVAEIIATWGQDVHMSAYLRDNVDEAAARALLDRVVVMPEVAEAHYVSSAEAAAWMAGQVEGISRTLDALGPRSLPASIEIQLRPEIAGDPGATANFARMMEQPEVEQVDYGAAWVERFQSFLGLLALMGALMGLLVIATAAFVVMNTARLVVYSRRDELEIQRLVGGTDLFIVAPFAVEGAIQGVIGSALAMVALWLLHQGLLGRLREALSLEAAGELSFLPASTCWQLALLGVVTGTLAFSWSAWRGLRSAP